MAPAARYQKAVTSNEGHLPVSRRRDGLPRANRPLRTPQYRAGSVLVIDDHQRMVGIFTGCDAVRIRARGKSVVRTTLDKAMTPNPVTVTPDQRAIDALRAMSDGGFRHLPVVEAGRIWGIVSRGERN